MKSIQEIRVEFQNAAETELDALCRVYLEDERKGVRALIEKVEKRRERLETERARIEKMKAYEYQYEHLGYVCGIDEAGRGPLAGPVVAGRNPSKDCGSSISADSSSSQRKSGEELASDRKPVSVGVGYGMPGE